MQNGNYISGTKELYVPDVLNDLPPACRLVYWLACILCDYEGFVELKVLEAARENDIPKTTLQRAIKRLVSVGLLKLIRRRTGRGNGCIYRVVRFFVPKVPTKSKYKEYKHYLRNDTSKCHPQKARISIRTEGKWQASYMKQLRLLIEKTPYSEQEKDCLVRSLGKVIWHSPKAVAEIIWDALYHRGIKIKIPVWCQTIRQLYAWFRWFLNQLIARFKREEPDPIEVEAWKNKPSIDSFRKGRVVDWDGYKKALDDWIETIKQKKIERDRQRQKQQGKEKEKDWDREGFFEKLRRELAECTGRGEQEREREQSAGSRPVPVALAPLPSAPLRLKGAG